MRTVIYLVLLIVPALLLGQNERGDIPRDMPVHEAALGLIPDVYFSSEIAFELALEINKRPAWRKLINQKRMAIGIMDLSDKEKPMYASLNGSHMMYAASLPKIAVLLAVMDAIDKGTLEDTEVVRKDLRLMISKSNNQATTRSIDRVGFQKIANILEDPQYLLYDREGAGGLWVGKRYAASGKRNPDPLKGLSHAATADQVLRFYKMLAYGELISPERSLEMLKVMMNPALHHKFVNTLDRVNPNAKVFRKSGSWKQFHADSAIVWGKDGRKYILVALIEDANGGAICKEMVKVAEKILYKEDVKLLTKS